MAQTYIFGHKNPDSDAICSSIALSNLLNELGEKTVPKALGKINNETKFVLDYFKVNEPDYLNDVKVRIKNVKYDKKAYIDEESSIEEAFKMMQKENITAIPLIDNKKILTGYVTLKEIAKYLINGNKERIDTTFNNVLNTLNAKPILEFDEEIEGNILVVGLKTKDFSKNVELTNEDILIVGDRYRILEYAIAAKVKLIILPMNSQISDRLIKKAEKNKVNIIETELSSYQISNKILLSNYIKNINTNHNPITFNKEDYYSDFKQMTHKINHTNYPVVNNKGECLGLIRLTGPDEYEKQKVILVDHNNFHQSVDGIEEADILAILDHHNLGAIGTLLPINFRSKPVGSTCTMVYELYNEKNIKITKQMAGLMISGLLSDTLILKSPTTTEEDKEVAKELAKIAEVDINKYGIEMLKAASSIKGKTVSEIITSDFKDFNINSKDLGIGQVMTMDLDYIMEYKDEFIKELNKMTEDKYEVVVLFITDVIKQGSYVLYNDDSEGLIRDSFGLTKAYQGVFLPNVLSRKKQILPSIMATMDNDL